MAIKLAGMHLALAAILLAAGCCIVPGEAGTQCGLCGPCGSHPGQRFLACHSGCGEVYLDEWLSHPPQPDPCMGPPPRGRECGDCGRCSQCQPLRNFLRVLIGPAPVSYHPSSAGHFLPATAECDSCTAGPVEQEAYFETESSLPPSESAEGSAEPVPTPAPEIEESTQYRRRLAPRLRQAAYSRHPAR
ncbi:MAG: hypothetical protein KatS3mg111_2295 [Pirellulaceae bacterium]|nr:MAG: hypothetical protein KatS3mg111_2295 [Pirellulaceae bacterium]